MQERFNTYVFIDPCINENRGKTKERDEDEDGFERTRDCRT